MFKKVLKGSDKIQKDSKRAQKGSKKVLSWSRALWISIKFHDINIRINLFKKLGQSIFPERPFWLYFKLKTTTRERNKVNTCPGFWSRCERTLRRIQVLSAESNRQILLYSVILPTWNSVSYFYSVCQFLRSTLMWH